MITPMDPHWYFYPRPPRGGRRKLVASRSQVAKISTHALREEGDRIRATMISTGASNFYPRPPRGGRPQRRAPPGRETAISTHALREEGDGGSTERNSAPSISTHALREEGDRDGVPPSPKCGDFYPRPPRGGRHVDNAVGQATDPISTHALREEGDKLRVDNGII